MALNSPQNGASGSGGASNGVTSSNGGAEKKLKASPEANFDIVISSDDSDFEP